MAKNVYGLTAQSIRKLRRTNSRVEKQPVNVRQNLPDSVGQSDTVAPPPTIEE